MSSVSAEDGATLKQEYEQLSKEASALAALRARRRADIALMRAEAATVAVSLEGAKDQLDVALRKESDIRSKLRSPSQQETLKTNVPSDQGLVRALTGQLEVTKDAVRAAKEKRTSLRDEIHKLRHGKESLESRIGLQNTDDFRKDAINVNDRSSAIVSEDNVINDGTSPNAATTQRESQSSRTSAGDEAILFLQETFEMESSFRSDHARIWRDVTMPNLALVQNKSDSSEETNVILGVVTERIFEGVTCFTPSAGSAGKDSSAKELKIEDCSEITGPSEAICEMVSEQYGTMVATTGEDDSEVRLIATTKALDKITDLVSDHGTDAVKRRYSTPERTQDDLKPMKVPTAQTKSFPTYEARRSSSRTDPANRDDSPHQDSTQIHTRLSDPSEVLSEEQFSHLIACGAPARFQESALDLVYSTNVHGMSLHTLYHKAAKSSPTLVVIRDTKNRVFGCYAAQPWKASATRYYGSGESFVFGAPNSRSTPTIFKWSRQNAFFQFTSGKFLAIGGGAGSHFALWVDEDLLMGTTSACSTFESPPLTNPDAQDEAASNEFKILSLEVWGFVAHHNL